MRHIPWNLTSLRAVAVLTAATTFAASLTQIAFIVDGSDRSIERLPCYGLDTPDGDRCDAAHAFLDRLPFCRVASRLEAIKTLVPAEMSKNTYTDSTQVI
jgi:hypothetical protein